MTSIAIVYFSGSGHTHLMALAVAEGASKVADTKVELLRILGEQIVNGRWKDAEIVEKLGQADVIVFGTPTYMGGAAAQFKAFVDGGMGSSNHHHKVESAAAQFKAFVDGASEVWFAQGWKDKMAGGFTHSSSLSGDKQGTLLYLSINAAQHSMIWVSAGELPSSYIGKEDGVNRLGSFLGVMGQSDLDMSGAEATLDSGDRLTAEHYGRRIAEAANRWSKQLVPA